MMDHTRAHHHWAFRRALFLLALFLFLSPTQPLVPPSHAHSPIVGQTAFDHNSYDTDDSRRPTSYDELQYKVPSWVSLSQQGLVVGTTLKREFLRWPDAIKSNITWCFATPKAETPGAVQVMNIDASELPNLLTHEKLVEAFKAATRHWEAAAEVHFQYLQLDDCSHESDVWFHVRVDFVRGRREMQAFSPVMSVLRNYVDSLRVGDGERSWTIVDPLKGDTRRIRSSTLREASVIIHESQVTSFFHMRDLFVHEVGHVLGFRHEHAIAAVSKDCQEDLLHIEIVGKVTADTDDDSDEKGIENAFSPFENEDVTLPNAANATTTADFDRDSVMSYWWCGGSQRRYFQLSPSDVKGAEKVYGPSLHRLVQPRVHVSQGKIPSSDKTSFRFTTVADSFVALEMTMMVAPAYALKPTHRQQRQVADQRVSCQLRQRTAEACHLFGLSPLEESAVSQEPRCDSEMLKASKGSVQAAKLVRSLQNQWQLRGVKGGLTDSIGRPPWNTVLRHVCVFPYDHCMLMDVDVLVKVRKKKQSEKHPNTPLTAVPVAAAKGFDRRRMFGGKKEREDVKDLAHGTLTYVLCGKDGRYEVTKVYESLLRENIEGHPSEDGSHTRYTIELFANSLNSDVFSDSSRGPTRGKSKDGDKSRWRKQKDKDEFEVEVVVMHRPPNVPYVSIAEVLGLIPEIDVTVAAHVEQGVVGRNISPKTGEIMLGGQELTDETFEETQRTITSVTSSMAVNSGDGWESLDLSSNRLKSPNIVVPDLKRIKRVDLSRNELENVPPFVRTLSRLRELNLAHNAISKLPDWLGEVKLLERLDVSFTRIKSLPDELSKLSSLHTLLATDAYMQSLHAPLPTSLQTLKVDNNYISEMSSRVCSCSQLTAFHASNNKLEVLPECEEGRLNLVIGDFSRNSLTQLPVFLSRHPTLEVLDVSQNKLSRLPNTPVWPALTRLSINFNSMGTLPDLSSSISTLQVLEASSNRLSDDGLPKSLVSLEALRVLQLSHNKISHLPGDMHKLKNIEVLTVRHNNLVEIPSALYHLRLKDLVLDNNHLTGLPPFELEHSIIDTLSILDIHNNPIDRLDPTLNLLSHLTTMRAAHTNLTSIPDQVCTLSKLEFLDVSRNNLIGLPHCLGNLTSLTVLNVGNNKISEIPEICNLRQLDVLDVRFNAIEKLQPLRIPSGLTELNLHSNSIETVAEKYFCAVEMSFLRRLDLSENRMKAIDIYSILEFAPQLRVLQLSRNNIHTLGLNHHMTTKKSWTYKRGGEKNVYEAPFLLALLGGRVSARKWKDSKADESVHINDGQRASGGGSGGGAPLYRRRERSSKKVKRHSKIVFGDYFLAYNVNYFDRGLGANYVPLKASSQSSSVQRGKHPLRYLDLSFNSLHKRQQSLAQSGFHLFLTWFCKLDTLLVEISGFRAPFDQNYYNAVDISNELYRRSLEKGIVFADNCGYDRIPAWVEQYSPKEMHLQENKLTSITRDQVVKTMEKLHLLDLRKNKLSKIPEELLSLPNLKSLDVGWNMIDKLPDFGADCKLEMLDVSQNALRSLPNHLKPLAQTLKSLKVHSNFLEALPQSIGELKFLDSIMLQDNLITSLPESIGNLPELSQLSIAANSFLTHLPQSFAKLYKMHFVDLHYCALKEFPPVHDNVKVMHLRQNAIQSLPEDVGRLRKLKMMDLRDNLIESLPTSIGEWQRLKSLSIDGNLLRSIPDTIGKLSDLYAFTASTNRLSSVPKSLLSLPQLETLVLSNNNLTSLPDFAAPQLHYLSLQSNRLRSIPSTLGGPTTPKLVKVQLRGNRLTSVPPSACAAGVQALFLQNNQLTELPKCVNNTLFSLTLHGNNITALDQQPLLNSKIRCLTLQDNPIVSVDMYLSKVQNRDPNFLKCHCHGVTTLTIGCHVTVHGLEFVDAARTSSGAGRQPVIKHIPFFAMMELYFNPRQLPELFPDPTTVSPLIPPLSGAAVSVVRDSFGVNSTGTSLPPRTKRKLHLAMARSWSNFAHRADLSIDGRLARSTVQHDVKSTRRIDGYNIDYTADTAFPKCTRIFSGDTYQHRTILNLDVELQRPPVGVNVTVVDRKETCHDTTCREGERVANVTISRYSLTDGRGYLYVNTHSFPPSPTRLALRTQNVWVVFDFVMFEYLSLPAMTYGAECFKDAAGVAGIDVSTLQMMAARGSEHESVVRAVEKLKSHFKRSDGTSLPGPPGFVEVFNEVVEENRYHAHPYE